MTDAQLDAMKQAEDEKAYESRFPSKDQQKALDAVKNAEVKLLDAVDALQIAAGETENALSPGWARVVSVFNLSQGLADELDSVIYGMERE